MANDLLKNLEDKINEAIETIELSRMEVSDLKEQNKELEGRYADWETRLSTLIEKFEQLEEIEESEDEEKNDLVMLDGEEGSEDAVEAEAETQAETEEALNSEDEEEYNSDVDEELGTTFEASTDSLNESSESAQHYA